MNSHINRIGFSQRIRLEWFDYAADLALVGNDRMAISAALHSTLRDKVSVDSNAKRGNRAKIISILMKTWVHPPREMGSLRDSGLELLGRLPNTHRIVIHWGMVMAVYPFWAAVAGVTGRLLHLQGSAAAAHVQRRIREQYGERDTVSVAARRVLRSYVDWGVLQRDGSKGVYRQGPPLIVDDPALSAWLVEAYLYAQGGSTAALGSILTTPCLFPFHLQPTLLERALTASPRLEVLRLGLDEGIVALRSTKLLIET